MESNWRFGVWEIGLTNFVPFKRYSLAAPSLDVPGWWVFNSHPSYVITRGSLVAPPGVVLPNDYYFQEILGPPAFPYGMAVPPDH